MTGDSKESVRKLLQAMHEEGLLTLIEICNIPVNEDTRNRRCPLSGHVGRVEGIGSCCDDKNIVSERVVLVRRHRLLLCVNLCHPLVQVILEAVCASEVSLRQRALVDVDLDSDPLTRLMLRVPIR